ncbi:MBL fold metallo-hydrolase [Candidatus Bathyarchaeota archaeon]|nr:MBL fold metallo-hydrolase [Candidatus Bathyarchaeota archaeon]
MELREITDAVGYIPDAVNIGVIRDGSEAIIVDTGLDKGTAKDILKTLEGAGLTVKAIINTHHHADHIGGNAYIKNRTEAIIYASEIEAGLIESPILEPTYLFSGAAPIQGLRNRFLLAKPSKVDHIITGNRLTIGGVEVGIVGLAGHSPNQIGVAVDGVLFCADTVFSMRVVEKYKLPFVQDVSGLKESLRTLKASSYDHYVPSHAGAKEDITELADANLGAIHGIEAMVLDVLEEHRTTEGVLAGLCAATGLEIGRAQAYYLNNTLTMAYLSSLESEGRVKTLFRGNLLHWEKT